MKYFKSTDKNQLVAFRNDISDIVMEMINISTNTQYFADGKLVDEPQHGYNTYSTEYIDFEYSPSEGHVYLFIDEKQYTTTYLYRVIKEKYDQFMEDIVNKFKEYPTIEIGYTGTTRYTLMINSNNNFNKIAININQTKISKNTDSFQWHVHYMSRDDQFYIPGIIFNKDSQQRMASLATIIYDAKNIYSLDYGARSSEYPLITDTTLYKKGAILKNPIDISKHYARFTILHQFVNKSQKYVAKRFVSEHAQTYQNQNHYKSKIIHYIKWEEVCPRKLKCVKQLHGSDLSKLPYHMSYNKAKKLGLIKETKSDDSDIGEDQVDYYCPFLDIPIYEDCYVIDIYRHKQLIEVEEKDILPTDIPYKPDPKYTASLENFEEKIPEDPLNTIKIDNDVKNKTVSKKKKTNYKLVYRVVEYKDPVHILISPAFIHSHIGYLWNQSREFVDLCMMFGFDAILYRTYCPKTLSQAIENLPIDSLTKEFLNAFTQISVAPTEGIEKNTNILVQWVQYNNKYYMLFNEFHFKQFAILGNIENSQFLFAASRTNNYYDNESNLNA